MAYLFKMVALRAGFITWHCCWLISGRPGSSSGFSPVLGQGSRRPGHVNRISLVNGASGYSVHVSLSEFFYFSISFKTKKSQVFFLFPFLTAVTEFFLHERFLCSYLKEEFGIWQTSSSYL